MNTVTNQLLILPKTTEKEESKLKRDALIAWIRKENINSGIIFCNSKNSVRGLVLSLSHGGIKACGMHNQMSAVTLNKNIEKFAHMESNFIICADDAIDGIEVPCIENLFNFDCPSSFQIFTLRKKLLDTSVEDHALMTIISTKEIADLKNVIDESKANNQGEEVFEILKTSAILDGVEDVAIPNFLETNLEDAQAPANPEKAPEPKKFVEESFYVRRNRYRNGGGKENKYINLFFNRADSNLNDYTPAFIQRKITINIQ